MQLANHERFCAISGVVAAPLASGNCFRRGVDTADRPTEADTVGQAQFELRPGLDV